MSGAARSLVVERSTASVINPLIDPDNPRETLDNCADALRFFRLPRTGGGDGQDAHYLLSALEAALRYEAGML